MTRAILLALALLASPALAEAPRLSAVIDCGSLRGSGAVDVLIGGRYAGTVRVECQRA